MKKRTQGSDLFERAQHGQFVPMIPSTTNRRPKTFGKTAGTTPPFGRDQQPRTIHDNPQRQTDTETPSNLARNRVP